jgi:hypothetical protein
MNEAVVELVDDYVDQHAKFAFQEFNLLRVARDQLPGDTGDAEIAGPFASKKLQYRDVIRDEIAAFRDDMQDQFRAVFAAAADDDREVEDALDEALAVDPFYPHVDDEAREAFAADLEDYLAETADAMRPLLRADGDDPWAVVTAVCERDEAEERLGSIAGHADVYEPHVDDVTIAVDFRGLDIFGDVIDYSDEAVRIIRHGEDYLRRVIARDVERAFDE